MDALFTPARYRHVVFTSRTAGRLKGTRTTFTYDPVDESVPLEYDEETFLRSLFRRASIDIGAYRMETLKRRIPAIVRALRAGSLDHAGRLLLKKPALLKQAINAALIGVTDFFRDATVFQALQSHLDAMTASPGESVRRGLRIWSAACSQGQELYSVAMLLADLNALPASDLLGTDCRPEAIQTARAGQYESEAVGPFAVKFQQRFLRPETDRRLCILPEIRSAVRWRVGDVLNVVEPGTWDIIMCRNMVMYLRLEAARGVWQRLEQALRPGGLLVTGKAERPEGVSGFSAVGPCLFRRDRF